MAESRWVTIIIASLLWSILLVRGQVNVMFESVVVVNETIGSFNICLNFSETLTNDTIINISVDNSSQARNGTDFVIPSEVELQDNTSKICINVLIIDDDVIERSNESAVIIFSSDDDSELIFEHNSIQLIILSLDELVVTVDNMNRSVNEGDTLSLCANLSSSNYSFSFNVTATANYEGMTADSNDTSSFTSQSLEFMQPAKKLCFSININNTDSIEGDETFRIEWALSGAPPNVRITPPTLTVITIESQLMLSFVNDTTITVTEGDTFSLCIMFNGVIGLATVSINFTLSGDTANVTSDPKDLLTFESGNQQCINVTTSDNSIIEPSKMVTFTFFNSIGASFSGSNTTTVIIEDNSTAVVGFNTTMNSVEENSTFRPQLTIFEGQINIDFNISITAVNGTAKAGIDFNFIPNNPYKWSVRSPPAISIDILNDNIVEDNKRFSLNLIVNSNFITTNTSNLNVIIVDNDMSILSIPKSKDVSESAGSVMLCFTPSLQIEPKLDNSNYMLYYRTENDKAIAGRDYTLVSGRVDIPSRSTSRQCISINITYNDMMEGQRNFLVIWSLESGIPPGVILENNMTNVTIIDDDITPLPSSSPPSTPTPPPSTTTPGTSSAFPLLVIVGVIVGVVLACLLFLIVLIIVILCVKMRTNRQGFYTTYEDKGDAPQMLRYSASLRSLQSQTVMPADPRDKENEYMV